MTAILADPVVLICSATLVAGLFGLFWAIGKFRRLGLTSPEFGASDDLFASAPLRDVEFAPPVMSASPEAPAVGRDVADRLESMTQRLAEMQSMLMKQSSAANAPGQTGPGAGSVGQGFSPETIEKLLKIIGNVIQQVDVLQKSLNLTKESSKI